MAAVSAASPVAADGEPAPAAVARRSGPTGDRIVTTALRLFRERGYDATTMRVIAAEAGVSLGSAYYYFSSKEHLVQAYYDRTQEEHLAAARPVLDGERTFGARLLGVLRSRVDTMNPYKEFAAAFFRNAADPRSPLSPFSPESRPARDASTAIYREVVEGSDVRCAADLRAVLPDLLWLYQMGIVLFWVYDASPGAANTYRLLERTVPLVARLVELSRLRLLRSTVEDVVGLLADLGVRPSPGTGA